MNCLEYRRELTTSPRDATVAMAQHRDGCAACAAFARTLHEQELLLTRALRTGVPESLAARILFKQRTADYQAGDLEARMVAAFDVPPPAGLSNRILARVSAATEGDLPHSPAEPTVIAPQAAEAGNPPRRARLAASAALRPATRLAMAASLALAVAIGALVSLSPSQPAILDAVVEHVETHRWSLDNNEAIPRPMIDPVLRMVGLELDPIPNVITHATPCDVQAKLTVHFVMIGEHGKVSVFVMPGQFVDDSASGHRGEFESLVLPVRNGSLAVVGQRGEDLQTQALTVRNALRWRM